MTKEYKYFKNKYIDDEVSVNNDFSTTALEAKDNYFDFVLNKDFLEHLLDPAFLIAEINRVLKPNGLFVLHVPNDFDLFKRIQFVFTNDTDTFNYFPDAEPWNQPHIRFFGYTAIRQLLQSNGFEILQNYSCFFAHFPIIQRIPCCKTFVKWIASKLPSQFARGLTVLAKKKTIDSKLS